MHPFSLLIKPASADCNLRCSHCFYSDRSRLYPATRTHRMSGEVLERLVASYMATPQPRHVFGWQGGEPTLMGIDFFRLVTELQQRHGHPGAVVANGLQTNATLINDDLAAHFARFQFLLGVSIDGPAAQHDHYRRDQHGCGSFAAAWRGIEILRHHHVAFNILTLVTNANIEQATATYRYLCENGFRFQQYIPCVEFDTDGNPMDFTITGNAWGRFLCDLFDVWRVKDTRRISIRLFDSILARMVDNQSTICHMGDNCCQYVVVEHNGDVYPCDFFVTPELRLGNIMTDDWETMMCCPAYIEFGARKRVWNKLCDQCEWQMFCAGDCLKHRLHGADSTSLAWLCSGWKMFYHHTFREFQRLAATIVEERSTTGGNTHSQRMVNRNDPCPCGSGIKYKKCCMKKGGNGVRVQGSGNS